jgi:hypothetical protein
LRRTSPPSAIQLPRGGPPDLLSDQECAALEGKSRDGYSLAVGIGRLLRSWAAGPETQSSARKACARLADARTAAAAWRRCSRELARLKRLLRPSRHQQKSRSDGRSWDFTSTRDDIESLVLALGVAVTRVDFPEGRMLLLAEAEHALLVAVGELDTLAEPHYRLTRPVPSIARKKARRLLAITMRPDDGYWVELVANLSAPSRSSGLVSTRYRPP